MLVNNDKIIEPNNAFQNPSTSNPGVIALVNISNKAFTTRENKPRVRKLSGRDINSTKGLINKFIKAITTHTIIAVQNPCTLIPGSSQAVKIIATENNIHFIIKSNISSPPVTN
jgi:hypothetical protein